MDSIYDYFRQHSRSSHFLLDIRPGFTTTAGLVLLVAYLAVRRARQRYASIPAIGGSGLFQSYLNGIRFLSDPGTMIEEGYKKFGEEGIFRIPTPINWLVTLSPDRHLHETRGPNGHLLSASAARYDISSPKHLLSPELYHFRYHVPIIRGPLVKNIEWLEEIRNEISVTCEEMMPVSSEWKSIPLLPATRTIITRSLYRIMLSEPDLYRNPLFIDVMVRFSVHYMKALFMLMFFPNFLKSPPRIVMYFLSPLPKIKKEAYAFLAPKIEEKLKNSTMGKQNDLISYFIEAVEEKHRNVFSLYLRVLHLNVAVVHTTSETSFILLMELAKRPEYIPILREEIESAVAKHGWTKLALSSMEKLESFMMETLRFNSPDLLNSPRKALTDYVLDNGIRIPKGSFVTVVETSRHRDESVYPNAKEFDGLRFYNKNKEASKEGNQPRQFTTISSDLIIFGVGPQACPGRFFATNVLKILLGYVLLTYDIKQDPKDPFVFGYKGLHWVPDPTKRLLFRERATE